MHEKRPIKMSKHVILCHLLMLAKVVGNINETMDMLSTNSSNNITRGRGDYEHWHDDYQYDIEPYYPNLEGSYYNHHHHHHHPTYPCICVPYHLCKEGGIDSDGAGHLDPRTYPTMHPHHGSKCHDHFLCCPIIHDEPTTRATTTTTTSTTTEAPIAGYWGCGIRNRQGLPDVYVLRPNRPNEEAFFGEFPWQAAILKRRGHYDTLICGGALIDPMFVLTAAHCIKSHPASHLRVRLGEWDTRNETLLYPKLDVHIKRIIIHPEFNPWNLQNDLAVIVLDTYVPFSPNIMPICLPTINENFDRLRCVVTGWGQEQTGSWGRFQTILKKVELPIVNNTKCQTDLRRTRLGQNYVLDPRFICAGGEEGRDACKGDGGGALACQRGGVYRVAGIVSWGIGCGQRDVPGVYIRVSSYVTWILSVIQEEHINHESYQEHLHPWS